MWKDLGSEACGAGGLGYPLSAGRKWCKWGKTVTRLPSARTSDGHDSNLSPRTATQIRQVPEPAVLPTGYVGARERRGGGHKSIPKGKEDKKSEMAEKEEQEELQEQDQD